MVWIFSHCCPVKLYMHIWYPYVVGPKRQIGSLLMSAGIRVQNRILIVKYRAAFWLSNLLHLLFYFYFLPLAPLSSFISCIYFVSFFVPFPIFYHFYPLAFPICYPLSIPFSSPFFLPSFPPLSFLPILLSISPSFLSYFLSHPLSILLSISPPFFYLTCMLSTLWNLW